MAVDEHAGRYSISSISGSHPHLVQVNAKVNTYGKPPNFPKTSNEVFPSRRGWKGPRPSTGELLESAALVSEAKAGNASMRDTRARYCVDTGSLYCECFPDIPAMSRNTEDKDSGNGDLFPEVCRCAEKIQTERDKFFDKAVRAIKSHEKIALIDKSNLFTSQTGKSLAAISKTIFETAGKVDECLKQLLRFEGGILEVLHCVESSRARRDCLKIKDAVAFLLDIRESIKMSELLAEKEEPLASAQIASRCSRLLASPERHLFGETAEVGEVICINELRSKLDSIVCDMRLRLTNCLLDSIYTSLSGVIEARDLSDLDVNDNEDLTRRYMPSIAPALIELDFHPAITQNYSKMLIEACLSLPEKLFKYALNVDSSEINPRKCNDAKNAIMVSAFRTTYASLITLFERVMYCHSILIDATPDLQRGMYNCRPVLSR